MKPETEQFATLERIRSLVIPPAWSDVWICPIPEGHLQVTARDARGRKQYRYHPDRLKMRERRKTRHLVRLLEALPRIRRHVTGVLATRKPTREFAMAAAIAGTNQAYAEDKRPTTDLHLPRLDEASLGQLFQMLMLATVVEGRLMGVNPYGQPGVESYKRNMRNILKAMQNPQG